MVFSSFCVLSAFRAHLAVQDDLEGHQDGLKTTQDPPRTLQDALKTLPRRPQDAPQTPQDASQTPSDAPRRLLVLVSSPKYTCLQHLKTSAYTLPLGTTSS